MRLQVLERRRKRADPGYDDDGDDSSGHDRNQYPSAAAAAAAHDINAEVRAGLGRVSISRVFDVVGLWQVLDEIEVSSRPHGPKRGGGGGLSQKEHKAGYSDGGDNLISPRQGESKVEGEEACAVEVGEEVRASLPEKEASAARLPSPATSLPPLRPPVPMRVEVSDSEDDDDALSSPPASVKELPEPRQEAAIDEDEKEAKDHEADDDEGVSREPDDTQTTQGSGMPDMILITHFSTLLSALFTQSGTDRASAHTTLQLLSTHIRYLARSSDSVVMLLNTTTTAATTSSDASRPTGPGDPDAPPADLVAKDSSRGNMNMNLHNRSSRPLDPTLRSIFNPAPTMGDAGTGAGGHGSYGAAGNMLSRRNKPTFGLTFAQFLDVHLLCTRLPRTRSDAEAMVSTTGRSDDLRNDDSAEGTAVPAIATGRAAVEYCWAVEVLLDELGVWAAVSLGGKTARRVNREQRWGAVRVDRESGVVENAFDGDEANKRYQMRVDQGPIQLAAGFGGRRV